MAYSNIAVVEGLNITLDNLVDLHKKIQVNSQI